MDENTKALLTGYSKGYGKILDVIEQGMVDDLSHLAFLVSIAKNVVDESLTEESDNNEEGSNNA